MSTPVGLTPPASTASGAATDREAAPAPLHAVTLRRAMGTRDLVLFNLVAVIGIRWLATSAKSGPSALVLWLLAALLFFVPQGLAVSELSTLYPDEGGIYSWTRRRFGERHGFLCGWCYWVVNVLYYPQILISCAVVATFIVGRSAAGLADSWPYVLTFSFVALWVAVGLNIVGLGTGKWLQNAGGVGTYAVGVILCALGVYALATHSIATQFTWRGLVPNFGSFDEVNLWASIAFAFAGMELAATMGGEIKDPRRTLPRAVYLSAPLIVGCYLVGTAAMLLLIPPNDINVVSGFVQAIDAGARQIGPAVAWLAPMAAVAYVIGNIGGVGAWISGPARVAFVIGLDKYFPPAFGRIHPRWGTPYVAILIQAAVASIILFLPVLGKGTGVEKFYIAVLDAQILIYFIPFMYLFACLIFDRAADLADRVREGMSIIPGGAVGRVVIGGCGFFVTVFAMVVAVVPPSDESAIAWFLKVVGGAGIFILLGAIFYWRGARTP
jgi:glutamate:GABA antiporter